MADPFEILAQNQVSAPGLVNAYEAGQSRRLNQVLLQRKIQMEDRAQEMDLKRQDVMSRIFQPKGGGQSSGGGAAPSPVAASPLASPYAPPPDSAVAASSGGMPGLLAPYAQPAAPPAPQEPSGLVDPSALPPRTDGMEINPDAMRELMQQDPEMAMKFQSSVFNSNKEQLAEKQRIGEVIGKAAFSLKQLPPEQRRAALLAMVPQLRDLGIPDQFLAPQALAAFPVDDSALDRNINMGQSLASLVSGKRAEEGVQWLRVDNGDGTFTMMPMSRTGQPLSGGGGASTGGRPPPEAINYLRQNPSLTKEFDQKYGQGSAERVLNGGAASGAPGTFPIR